MIKMKLEEALEVCCAKWIQELWSGKMPEKASEHVAHQRQVSTLKQGRKYLPLLTEPFQDHPLFLDILQDCLLIHLYARILDDALDEALPVHRLQLLKIQPLFWKTLSQLASRYPDKIDAAHALIAETVQGVQSEWQNIPCPAVWGAKNHHLLLAPVLLSPSLDEFYTYRESLSRFIWLLQANEEQQQDYENHFAKYSFQKYIPGPNDFQLLKKGGWHELVLLLEN